MSCVPHVMYGLVSVVNLAVALLRICMTKSKVKCCYQVCDGCLFVSDHTFCSQNLLDGLDCDVKIAMAHLLTCKSKTWGQDCGGCISKLLCICLVYHM